MRWVFWGLAGLIAAVLLVVLVGYLIPRDHVASVEGVVAASPERVWEVMTAVEDYPTWRRGVERVERLPDRDGRLAWREVGSSTMSLGVVEQDRGRRWVVRILDEDLPFGGTWTYTLAPEAGGTRIALTEEGSVYNPVFRFVSRFIMGHDATMQAWLDDLRDHLGEDGS